MAFDAVYIVMVRHQTQTEANLRKMPNMPEEASSPNPRRLFLQIQSIEK